MVQSGYSIAVDIGGTFTDVVLRDGAGRVWVDKTLTTYSDLLTGFFRAVDLAMKRAGVTPEDVDDVVVHATTVVTNALIERRGPKTALLVTEGFRDVLAIRDEHRFEMYDTQIEFPEPLIPSELTFGLKERVAGNGDVLVVVDHEEVRALARTLKELSVKSVAICFLNSFKCGDNERAVRDTLRAELPELFISVSCETSPQIREYWRASTTSINAYTQPITQPYLKRLVEQLGERGFPHKPLLMLSNGGVVDADVAGRFPVRMIESGPAAGALAASFFADKLDIDDLLAFDMGGTTAKVCLVRGRQPMVTGLFEVDKQYRHAPGSGYPVTVSSIDMIEIGAGGGSIAWQDSLGLLKVGPKSAASEPGPVCYGRGGQQPTVTDANLVLGLLSADNFLGGDMRLDLAAARAVMGKLGEALRISGEEAALGIFRVVGENMAAAARAHATERGIDPRGMPVLAFGGAGPLHANYLAELLESNLVIFPPMASVLSAFGTLVSPPRLDLGRSYIASLDDLDWDSVSSIIDEMRDEGRASLMKASIAEEDIRYHYAIDMRYRGQANEVTVLLDSDPGELRDRDNLRRAFENSYLQLYGLALDDVEVEVVTWRLSSLGPQIKRDSTPTISSEPAAPTGHRPLLLQQNVGHVPVFSRSEICVGQVISGPAIIEERETTLVILSGWSASMNGLGCVVTTRNSK